MWGSYIQGEINKAEDKAKDSKQAKQRIQTLLRRLLREDEDYYRKTASVDAEGNDIGPPPPRPGRFRDPVSVIRTGD